jgi:hypothetical protein
LVLFVVGVAALASAAPASALLFTVDTNADVDATPGTGCPVGEAGTCSLRDAITLANTTAALDEIEFNIAGSPDIIEVGTALPTVAQPLEVDGAPSFSPPAVEINGPGPGPGTIAGLAFGGNADNSTVRGLAVVNFDRGIELNAADGVDISDTSVGLTLAGTPGANGDGDPAGTTEGGIVLLGSATGNSIGVSSGGGLNHISANDGSGISIANAAADNNTIQFNRIGTDLTGTGDFGNTERGIHIVAGSDGNTIANNTIVNNGGSGISTSGFGTTIRQNSIGVSGIEAMGNSGDGIVVGGVGGSATIGGPAATDGNEIVANGDHGILLNSSGNPSVIQNNDIGVLGTGATTSPGGVSFANQGSAISISSSMGNQIGGAGAGNVLSNNEIHGVQITGPGSTANRVEANTIGLTAGGFLAGNAEDGVRIEGDASGNTIGSPGAGNVVSGNVGTGIRVDLAGSTGNVIQSNIVGLNAAGTLPRPNGVDGINVDDGDGTVVGGLGAGEGNTVASNPGDGIEFDSGADDGLIRGNAVGTNAAGTLALPNVTGISAAAARLVIEGNAVGGSPDAGVEIDDSADSVSLIGNRIGLSFAGNTIPNAVGVLVNSGSGTIGGPGASGNVITGNVGAGVLLAESPGRATIAENSIFGNGGLGIDLNADGVTANDPVDADAGENGLQNFPDIASAQFSGGQTTVAGSISSTPATELTLRFFASGACDPSGFGEGQRSLGSATVTTDANGDASFSAAVGDTSAGEQVTATATGPTGTSEFSACRAAEAKPPEPEPEPEPALCRGKTATIEGTDSSETIRGTSGKDVIAAGAGNDRVSGLGGNDIVCGEGGNDTLAGGGGKDVLDGGDGRDALNGGSGKGDLCLGGKAKDSAARSCERARSA